MERFKVFDVLHHEHLSLINLSIADPAFLSQLFERLEEKEIKIKFLVSHHENDGRLHLIFCVERSSLKTTQNTILEIPLKEDALDILPEVGMVAIHGPHFAEEPGIINVMHSALSSQHLQVLAISTTLSTSYFIIPAPEVVRALDILREAFEIPRGKI
jgi:aspartokinase